MSEIKENIQQYLPRIEEFLTSMLLEETNIDIVTSDAVPHESALQNMKENDIFLFSRDEEHNMDVIVVLDPEWFGLLSSIMLGIEEKSKNETTIELLEEFSGDLSQTVLGQLEENEIHPDLQKVRVLSLNEVEEHFAHAEYSLTKLEVEGLADNRVRAELLIGNPEAILQAEEPETVDEQETDAAEKGGDTSEGTGEEDSAFPSVGGEKEGAREEVISGRTIEFAEFDAAPDLNANGESHSMDLLKDVEIDVSVELGRIELPLGKVLQLTKGSVIELEKLAGEPVDILVNGHRIAHGEVVVIDEHFGVRISNLITTRQRLAGLSHGS